MDDPLMKIGFWCCTTPLAMIAGLILGIAAQWVIYGVIGVDEAIWAKLGVIK